MNSGRMIGHYRIIELLGSGAMGTVQVAVDTYIDRPVAIKSLRPELTQDPDFVSRFRGEAKSLARLNHPNIATLFSPILDGAELHLVMELVQGKALDDILRDRGKPLGVKESLAITAQAADGLSYAHEMGVIHRDIKPANLMIANDGRVKIMDFGIARVQGSVRLTRSGTAVGTPLYMSPEQCRGGEGDERSDIYSLAMVLYEMLSGAPPFKFDTEYDLIQAQITATPTPLVPKIAGVTPTLEAAIMTALAKKPEQRFQTMRAFSDAIGATALRPDATGVIRNATHLIEVQPEAEQEAKKTSALDVAQSRALYVSRRWGALGAPAKATVAASAAAIVAFAVILLKPSGSGERVAPPAIEQSGLAAPAAGETIRDLRLAISGSAASAIKASDFDYVPNGVKLRELPAARVLAATGDAEAQFALGMLLSEAPGSVDKAGAFAAFRRAAEKNYPDAQVNLAVMYQNGVAPDGRDLAKASEWFAKAAEQGNGKALFWMGCYYQFGWGGLSQDSKRAIDQFSKAVAVRYAKATDALQAINNPGAPSPCK